MLNFIEKIARPEVLNLTPYGSARRTQKRGKVFLNANENPWDSDKNFPLNRYPEPQPNEILKILSQLYQVEERNLLVTRGSDEAIDLIIRAFCRPTKDKILTCPPTFGLYELSAYIHDCQTIKIPLLEKNNFNLNLDQIYQADSDLLKVIFLCAPNNPTGNLIAIDDILDLTNFYKEKAIIVVDEAYIEFAKQQSLSQNIAHFPNLIVLRTLSKAYGLAGVRCGCLIAHPEIINLLLRIIPPYPIAASTTKLITEVFSTDYLNSVLQQINTIILQRDNLYNSLKQLKCVDTVFPSSGNFILVRFKNSEKVLKTCEQKGIVLRDRSHELNLNNCIRISIGKENENQYLLEVLQSC